MAAQAEINVELCGNLECVFQKRKEHWPAINGITLQVYTNPVFTLKRYVAVGAVDTQRLGPACFYKTFCLPITAHFV